jgi:RNA polymerase sigma-70 factor, ECF subfamily
LAAVSPLGRAADFESLPLPADARFAGALFEVHSPKVFAYCLSKLGRREDAEDAVQTTFLHAVRGLRRGVVPAVELAWLLGIARNVCLSRHESVGRRGRLELVCDPVDLERTAARHGRGDELIGLEDALARLPEQQRRAVLLRDWRGLSYAEVAERLDVSLANAETLIFRGRRSLAELLGERPATTRRRLASLGNLGSLLTAVKSALTGASAIAKVAAATATVAAVSGAGLAVGTSPPAREPAAPASAPVPAAPPAADVPIRRAAPPTAARRPDQTPAPPARPARGAERPATSEPDAAPTPIPPVAVAPTAPDTTSAAAPPRAGDAAPAPAAAAPPTVQSTVDKVTPALPVPLPEIVGSLPVPPLPVEVPPVVETVVEAVPPVTVALPPVVPIAPVTIDPKALLP